MGLRMSSLKQCYIDGFIKNRRWFSDGDVAEYLDTMFTQTLEAGMFDGHQAGFLEGCVYCLQSVKGIEKAEEAINKILKEIYDNEGRLNKK